MTSTLGEYEAGVSIGSGRSADVVVVSGERVLKHFYERIAQRQVEHEFMAQKLARELGVPSPAAFEIVERNGRPGIVMERAKGRPMLERFRWTPWSILDALRQLGRLHARVNALPGHRLRPQKAFIARHIRAAKLNPEHQAACLRVLERLPEGNRLCHGDLHPGNIIWGADGPLIIDWGTACNGCPAGDAARTLLLLGLAPLPRGLRYMAPFRKLAQHAYLGGYVAAGGPSRTEIAEWWLPVAAARLAGIHGRERPLLRSMVERACSTLLNDSAQQMAQIQSRPP